MMTEITDEGRKLAAEWRLKMGSLVLSLEQVATDHLALKAEHEKAVADLREIAAISGDCVKDSFPGSPIYAIAAKYRETDPLVEAFQTCWPGDIFPEGSAAMLRAELSKRGFELARVKP